MNTAVTDLTYKQLMAYLRDYFAAHPELNDVDTGMTAALQSAYPGVEPKAVIWDASRNQLSADLKDRVRAAAASQNNWISTRVQRDMFHDFGALEVPEKVIVDGKIMRYDQVPLSELLRNVQAQLEGAEAQAQQHEDAARMHRQRAARLRQRAERIASAIQVGREHGVPPEALFCARA